MTTATLNTVRLQERIAAPHGRVDRTNGVIHGVKVLGRISRNGREYTREAIAGARSLYENVPVYANHLRATNDERRIQDKIGWLQNVRVVGESLVADLHLFLSDPVTAKVLEAAERAPRQLGLSHVAEGVTRREGGRLIVEEIKSVRSVDIVTDPATTSGLFESIDMKTEYPSDPRAFVRTLTADTFTPRNPFRLREAEDAKAGEIIGDEVGDLAIAEKRIGDVIKQIAERRDISATQRAKAIERLGALLDKIRSNYMDIDAEIAAVLKELPDKAEAAAMERAGQSSESLTRYLTGEARGGVGLRESASESRARSFARSIT